MSDGVVMPGAKERLASRAAARTFGFIPGTTPNAAPASFASETWAGVRIVPDPGDHFRRRRTDGSQGIQRGGSAEREFHHLDSAVQKGFRKRDRIIRTVHHQDRNNAKVFDAGG
jgi:hypothetical protein